jgi:MFS family permease
MFTDKPSVHLTQEEIKIVGLASLGGMLEFYDFIIYGLFSVYFAEQFFPSHSTALISVLKSYAVFLLGYVARPIGGFLFSHIGDEYGRKRVLVLTIVLMGASSLGMGLLPTYASIGAAAPCCMLLFRFIQGLAIGGELPSTYVYIRESMERKQGRAFGITMFGVNSGLLLGMLVNQLLSMTFSSEAMVSYAWRIPFILGGLLCVVSYLIRQSLQETQAFQRIHNKPRLPLVHLIQYYGYEVLIGVCVTAIMSGFVVVTVIFMPTYLHTILHFDVTLVGRVLLLVMLMNVVTIYAVGQWAQRVSCWVLLRKLLIISVPCVPCCYYLILNSIGGLYVGSMVLGMLEGMAALLIPMLLTSLFSTEIRLTGVAFCYNIGFTIFGGLAPMAISAWIEQGYDVFWVPVLYLMGMILTASVGLYMKNKSNARLSKVFV